MHIRSLISLPFLIVLFSLNSCKEKLQNGILVHDVKEMQTAISNAKPGDEIILADGIWKDIAIVFAGEGNKENPITLKAETPGKVFIEGESYLKIGGKFLIVNGLFFKNGYTPEKTIVDFKINDEKIANNCKITNCVIEDFTQPNRETTDHWVEFWGRNNEMSNCYLAGKSNFGPTVRVFLKGNEHIKNYHQIVNNHFGPRPRKGGPHGETLQLGDSYTSMTPSHANVSNNFFERCDGEVEIISSKSNFNNFEHNVFFECEGSLVLRHGNYATINGNIFIGNDTSKFMGGIRVINTGHWITNNYFYKIKGNEFRSALAVMNGIPKSPLNRYNQVTDVVVAYNSFVDCESPWQFSVGANTDKKDVLPASEIRSARPIRTILANNLIFNEEGGSYPIKNYDEVDGVTFKNNVTNNENKSAVQSDGIQTLNFEVEKKSDWLYIPAENLTEVYHGFDFETITQDLFENSREDSNSVGAIVLPVDVSKIDMDSKKYGPNWFSNKKEPYDGQAITISNENELVEGLKKANSGDILELGPGIYNLDQSLLIDKVITIQSKNKEDKATLIFSGTTETAAFEMNPRGNLFLNNIILKGENEQIAFASLEKNMSMAFNLHMDNSEIHNFKIVLLAYKSSFADEIKITNSLIKNCLNGLLLNTETDDKGDYNTEFLTIANTTFEGVRKNVINYYRGGYDESTIGGNLVVRGSTFRNCGGLEQSNILIQSRGIVQVDMTKNTFENNPVKYIAILWGEKGQQPIDNLIKNSGAFKIEKNLKQKLMY